MKCEFNMAWIGPCGKEDCKEHVNLVCSSCGAKATRECDETMGLVCGCLLCNDCEHATAEDGTNGGNFKHCKKSEQKFTPWYVRGQTPELTPEQWYEMHQQQAPEPEMVEPKKEPRKTQDIAPAFQKS